MQVVISKNKLKDYLFVFALALYVGYKIINTVETFAPYFSGTFRYVLAIVIICLIASMMTSRARKSTLILIPVLIIYIFIIARESEDTLLLPVLVLFIIAGANRDIELAIKVMFYEILIVLLIAILGSAMGILANLSGSGGIYGVRYFAGFSAPVAPVFLEYLAYMYVFNKKEKSRILVLAFLMLLNIYLFYQSNIRMAFYSTTIFLLVAFLMRFFKRDISQNKFKTVLAIVSAPLCALVSIALQVFYTGRGLFAALNIVLSNRLSYGHEAWLKYGLSLFGQQVSFNIDYSEGAYSYVDAAYLKYMIIYGVIFLILLVAGMSLTHYVSVKENEKFTSIILYFIELNAIFNPQILYLQFNPFILLIGVSFVKVIKSKGVIAGNALENSKTM